MTFYRRSPAVRGQTLAAGALNGREARASVQAPGWRCARTRHSLPACRIADAPDAGLSHLCTRGNAGREHARSR